MLGHFRIQWTIGGSQVCKEPGERVDEGEEWKPAMIQRVDLGGNREALYEGLFYFCTAESARDRGHGYHYGEPVRL